MELSFRRRFGLMSAGVGVILSFIASMTNTLDLALIIASTFLILFGIVLWFIG
ncbi:MAG: hypothetical protein ACLFTH_01655 [Candidatus Woesearchaeota archaeon]